jgi:hypothetical protein
MKETLTIQRDVVFGHTDQGVALTADIYGLRIALTLSITTRHLAWCHLLQHCIPG